MRLINSLFLVIISMSLSGCFRTAVHASPDMHVPSVLLTDFDSVSSHVNTKKELQGHMVDTIKLCEFRAQQLKKYQDKFNSLTTSK